ncbi:ATP-binding protein [Spirochaetota bacterium]
MKSDLNIQAQELISLIQFTEQVSAKIHGLIDKKAIFKAIKDEFLKSKKYTMSILFLSEDKTYLSIVESSLSDRAKKESEKKTKLKLSTFKFHLKRSSIYRKVIRNKTTAQVRVSDIIDELLPKPIASIVNMMLKYKNKYSMITPLYMRNKVIGAFAMSSLGFTEYLVPSIKNLAYHISASLEICEEFEARKKFEGALLESEHKLNTMFESISDGIVVTDLTGKIFQINQAAVFITGYKKKDHIIDKNALDFIDKSEKQETLKKLRNIFKYKKNEHFDCQIVRKNGGKLKAELSIALLYGAKGRPNGFICVMKDISLRRHLEEELLKTEKLKSVGVLAGGIAHDFNNILTGILGNASLAKRKVTPDSKFFDLLSRIETASLRASDLTQQLLTFSKGGVPVRHTASIGEFISESFSFALLGSQVKSRFKIGKNLWEADIDKGQMNQVINNLIINANQAMPDGGTITINAENVTIDSKSTVPLKKGRYIKIRIADTGIGISESLMPNIFDPYFTTKEKGSGLGLATSFSIIKNHEGYIAAESTEGAGTSFYIYLPASEKKKKGAARSEYTYIKGIGKILIMDNEDIVRNALVSMLVQLGYKAEYAKDGEEAIRIYTSATQEQKPFDAVIMDLTVPGGKGGKSTIKKLLEIDPRVKAIVSSGYANSPVMATYKKYGFKGVIIKPYKIEKLSEVLVSVLKANGH